MGVLSRALLASLVALAGCYSPSLRDCTVSCAAPGDCAGDQVCGSDGLCAAPSMAGRCATIPDEPLIDAPPPIDAAPRDAIAVDAAPPPIDAAPPIDAPPPPMVNLRVLVQGKGSVVITGVGTCSSEGTPKGDCTYMVPTGVEITARATDIKPDEQFSRWSSVVCFGQGAACTFTPILSTGITAMFEHVRLAEVR